MVTVSELRHFFLARFAIGPDAGHLGQVNGTTALPVQISGDSFRELSHFGLA